MASRKNRDNYGDIEFDLDLDFDFDVEPKTRSNKKNPNSPIDHIKEGAVSALKTKFTDPSHYKQMMRNALPKGFSQAWDAADTMVQDTRQLYDQAVKDLLPGMGSIARKVDALTPDAAGRFKQMTRSLNDKLSSELPYDYNSAKENAEESSIERMIGELGGAGFEERQADRETQHARDMLSEHMQQQRFASQQKLLGIVADNTSSVRNFLTTFNVNYQRKSLEIQARSYYALANILKITSEQAVRNKEFQNALLHNTSLPEYAKTSNVQRWKQVSKEQLFNKVNDGLFGKKSRVAAAGERLLKAGKEKLASSKEALADIDSMLEMLIDGREIAKMDAEMNGRKYSGWNSVGNLVGSMGGDAISDMISAQLKKAMEKNPKLMTKSFQAGRFALNPGAAFEKVRGSKRFKDMGSSDNELTQMLQAGLGGLMDLFAEARPDMTIKNTSIGAEGEDKLHTQMRTARSLNEIIPGYLARILREVTVLRTGDDKTGLLVYDEKAHTFKTQSRMASDLVDSLRKTARDAYGDSGTYSDNANKLYKSFVGKEELSGGDSKNIQLFLTKLARSTKDMDYTGEGIRKTAEYKNLDPSTKIIVDRLLDTRFSGQDELMSSANAFRMTKAAHDTRQSIGNLMGPIQEMIKNGHAELLERRGVLTKDGDGYKVNEAKYYEMFDDTIKSDMDLKGNIRSTKKRDGTASLNAYKRTENYTWNYKNGTGYGNQTYTGPMAQHVRQNFGEDTAPGGEQIDLVSMNGHSMAAIKKLADMVESMGAGEAVGYLRKIEENTAKMVAGSFGGGGGTGGGYSSNNTLSGHAGALFSGLIDKALDGLGAAGRMGKAAGNAAVAGGTAAANAASDFWSNNKQDFKKARDNVIDMAVKAAQKAAAFGSDLLFNQLPSAGTKLKGYANKALDFAKNMIQGVKDIYVQGSESPALKAILLEAGAYRDELTGKILKTMDDVASAKGNIVDAYGRTVLSLEDRARGIYDSTGQKVKSLLSGVRDFAIGAGMAGLSKLNELAGTARDKFKGFGFGKMGQKAMDKATQVKNKMGDYFQGHFGFGIGGDSRIVPVLVQIRDLISLSHQGKRGKAIMARKIEGLDVSSDMMGDEDTPRDAYTGQPINGSAGAASPQQAAMNAVSNAFGVDFAGLGSKAKGLWGQGQAAFSKAGWGDKFRNSGIGKKLTGGWGGLKGSTLGQKAGGFLARMKGFGGGLLSLGSSVLGGLLGGGGDKQPQAPGPEYVDGYGADDHAARLAELNAGKAASKYGDRAGESVQAAENARRANEERKQAGIQAGMQSANNRANRYAAGEGGLGKIISMAMAGMSSIASMASSLIGGIGSVFGLGKLGGGLLGKAGKAAFGLGKGALGLLAGGGKLLGGVGTGIMNVASKLPGAGAAARYGATAIRLLSVAGLATGGATSMLASTGALAGALLTNPIVLGALAVGGTAYLGYKAYKYFTKNNVNDFEKIRLMQYGLSGNDDTKAYNSKCLALENYFLEGKLAFNNGVASINSRAIKNEEMLEIMDIATDDQERLQNFSTWLNNRFGPVFLKHVNSLYKVDNKARLDKVADLDPEKQVDYLTGVEIGPVWGETVSPFKGLDRLSSDPTAARALTDATIKDCKSKIKGDKKAAGNKSTVKPDAAQKAAAAALPTMERDTIPKAPVPDAPKTQQGYQTRNTPDLVKAPLPENSQAAKYLRSIGSSTAPRTNSTMGFGGNGTPSADWSSGKEGMQFVKLGKDAKLEGMHPRMLEAFLSMAQEYGERTGKKIPVNEAFRSFQRQAELYAKHPGKAAKPGSSLHEFGLAMDLPTVVMKELEDLGLLKKYGFTRPVRGETWHMEPAGIQNAIQQVKQDPALADRLIQASAGRGGGGIGMTPSAKKGGRDAATAKAAFGGDFPTGKEEVASAGKSQATPSNETDVDMGVGAAAQSTQSPLTNLSTMGRDNSVKFPNTDVSGSIGDGTGKYDAVKKKIAEAAIEGGEDPNKMMLFSAMESSLNPSARPDKGGAKGLNQFMDGTWNEQMTKHGKKYGLDESTSRDDIRANTLLAAEYMKSKASYLRKAKGSDLEMVDDYMGHMFGRGGAAKLLRADPNAIAASVLPDAVPNNRDTFFNGSKPRTVGELREFLQSKLAKKAKEFGIQMPGSSSQATGGMTKTPYSPTEKSTPAMTTGYLLPSRAPDPSISTPDTGFDVPTPPKKPNNPLFAPRPAMDQSTQAKIDIFERFTEAANIQIEALNSIDEGINSKMVPLLQTIADGIQSMSGSVGNQNKFSSDSSSPSSQTNRSIGSSKPRRLPADVPAFDNRRGLTV